MPFRASPLTLEAPCASQRATREYGRDFLFAETEEPMELPLHESRIDIVANVKVHRFRNTLWNYRTKSPVGVNLVSA